MPVCFGVVVCDLRYSGCCCCGCVWLFCLTIIHHTITAYLDGVDVSAVLRDTMLLLC